MSDDRKDCCKGIKKWDGACCCLIHHCSIPNSCTWPVLRLESSCSRVLGAVGNDVAASAQSKHMGVGVKHSSMGLDGGSVRGRGCRMGLGV
jgi:hypothetical protein